LHAASRPVLVGDVGGTNVRFALARRAPSANGTTIAISRFDRLPGDDFASFDAALQAYLARLPQEERPDNALFALAGPVRDNRITLTNRSGWSVDGDALARAFGLHAVVIENDFAAMARAMPELPESAFIPVKPGTPVTGAPLLVAGPGTGVGMATLLPCEGGGWQVLTGEGGHASYAPGNAGEAELAEELRRRHGYVSRELVLAGKGLDLVMEALCAVRGEAYVRRAPAEVLTLAEQGDALCQEVCRMRAGGLMQMLGDAALTVGARAGVVIVGGVAERLIDWIRTPEAIARFEERGPMSPYMHDIPVRLVAEPAAPLFGAAALFFERANAAA
jgi:glucokinase